MSSPFLTRAFAHAHTITTAEFSSAENLCWVPALRGGESYTVSIPCGKGAIRNNHAAQSGVLTMAIDGLTINAIKSGFPFLPQIDDLFLIGPAYLPGGATPAADLPVYRILSVSDAEILSHYHITAERHV